MNILATFALHYCILTCLAEASSLESILVTMLKPKPCNLVLSNPKSESVKNFAEQMQKTRMSSKPMMIFTDPSLAVAKKISSVSKCIVGVSDIKSMDYLQNLLLSTFNRQLVGLLSSDVLVQSPNISITVNKKHHPLMLLGKNIKGMVKQSLVCDTKRTLDINVMRELKWIRKPMFDRLAFERSCSQGQHPLKDKSLVVSSYALPPYLHLGTNLEVKGGVTYDMVNAIAGHYEFTVSYIPYENWFIFNTNGTIGGSIAPVLFGQADFSLEQTKQHANSLGSMTSTTYTQILAYVERTPKPISQLLNISYTLDNVSWLFLLIACVAVNIVLYLTSKFEESKNVGNEFEKTTIYRTLEITLGILFQEFHTKRYSHENKGLVPAVRFIWVITSMFVVMAFSGNLKSSFVKLNYEERTMTLNEMVDKDMPIYTSTEMAEVFEATQAITPLHGRFFCQARKKNSIFKAGPDYMDVVIKKVVNNGGYFAINKHTLEFTRGKYLLSGSDLPLVAIPERYMSITMGMFFQSHDPRVEYFDFVINWMTDSGIVDGLFRKVLPFAKLQYQEKVEEHPLILQHFIISFIACLGGVFIAAVVLVIEIDKTCCTRQMRRLFK